MASAQYAYNNSVMKPRLLKILEGNPDCCIHYYDSGSYVIYKEKPRSLKSEYLQSITIYQGTDQTDGVLGYAPPLVVALATMMGIDVESV